MKLKTIGLAAVTVTAAFIGAFPLWSESITLPEKPVKGASDGIENVLQYVHPQKSKVMNPKQKASVKAVNDVDNLTQPLYGSVIAYNPSVPMDGPGLYRLSTDNTPNKKVFPDIVAEMGGVVIGDTYYGISRKQLTSTTMVGTISSYSMMTGEKLSSFDATPGVMSFDIAYDPVTQKVYGCFFSNDLKSYEFGTLDLSTGERPTICPLAEPWNSCAFDAQGQLWVLGKNGNFYKVDKETGVMEFIGVSGLAPQYFTSAAIDQSTGRFFTTVSPASDTAVLAEIDTATGKASVLHYFESDEEITGLAFWGQGKNDLAPGKIDQLTLSFPQGALKGKVSFKVPTKSISGETLDAGKKLMCHIEIDQEEYVAKEASPGEEVSFEITVASSGKKMFNVFCSNSYGNGSNEYVSEYIGSGTPQKPENVEWNLDGSKSVVTWKAVTASSDGGYVNPGEITYTVTRMPGSVVAAKDIKDLSFEETFTAGEEIAEVYYTVKAKYADKESEAASSKAMILGQYAVAPYNNEFSEEHKKDGWKIIDNNGDGKTWRYFNGMMFCDSGNGKIDEDDWFISVPIKLEKGKYYIMDSDLQSTNVMTQMHEFEVLYGKAPEIESQTSVAIAPTIIHEATWKNYSGEICPDETGNYYVAFHVLSKGTTNRVILRNIHIDGGRSVKVPAKVKDLAVTPAADLSRKAEVTFTAPAECYDGTSLAGITKVEIFRNDALIASKTDVKPGQVVTVTDEEVPVNGENAYTVKVYNEIGVSSEAKAEVFVGVRAPKEARNVVLTAIEDKPGYVKVTWDAPESDVEGGTLPAEKVSYNILDTDGNRTIIAEGLKDTSYEFKACDTDTQHLVGVIVQSVTDGGMHGGVSSNVIFIGGPLVSPLMESFVNGRTAYEMMYDPEGTYGKVYLQNDASVNGITSYDNDNGFASFTGQTMNDVANVIMGRIKLEAVNPFISLAIYGQEKVNVGRGTGPNKNEFSIEILDNDEWKPIYHVVVGELEDGKWTQISVPLTDYAGKIVEMRLRGKKMTYGTNYTYIDRIVVSASHDHNLSLSALTVPERILPDKEFEISAVVANTGLNDAADAVVEIYKGAELILSQNIEALKTGISVKVKKNITVSRFEDSEHQFKAVVKYSKDQKESDNELTALAKVLNPAHPVPGDFAGEALEEGGALLKWSAPEIAAEVTTVVEDMENSAAFEEYLEGWTFIDNDNVAVGGLSNFDMPGLIPGTSKKSFFVVNSEMMPDPEFFKPTSGKHYLATMFCIYGAQNDDWAISPCLSGNAQKIAFMAKSTTPTTPETFEILYSEGSLNITDFKCVRTVERLPSSWCLIQSDLPEGAKYFAIRCRSVNGGMLMIDDIKFESAGVGADLELEGYNLYRDGEKAVELDKDKVSHTDNDTSVGTHVYHLTARYNRGESMLTEGVEVDIKKISSVDDLAVEGIKIIQNNGMLQIINPHSEPILIVDINGTILYDTKNVESVNVALQPGIYVVKVGKISQRVIVR